MNERGAAQLRLTMRRITALALAAIILVMLIDALLRGPSIDEFATLHLSDLHAGFGAFADGWLHDTHPPFFTIWAMLLSSLSISSIPVARLLSNLPPLAIMIWTARRLTRRQPEQLGFHASLLLLVLSVPATIDAFATYGSGFWQITALTVLVQVARHITLADGDLRGRRDQGLAPIAIAAAACAIMVHYVTGIFAVALTLAIILAALAQGYRRWARLLIWTVVIAGLATIGFASLQSGHWAADLDRSWIASGRTSAAVTLAALGIRALLHNPVPLAGMLFVRGNWTKSETGFVALTLGTLAATLLLLMEIHAQQPMLSASNLAGLSVLLCAAMAALAAKFAGDVRLHATLAVMSVAVVVLPFMLHGPERHWQANAKKIAQIAATCPSTRIHAASPWLLRDGARSTAARRDEAIFARGYAHVGEGRGFVPQMVGRAGVTRTGVGPCPTLLWIEQAPANIKPEQAIAAARLTGLEAAHLTMIRSESGFVVRADRP